MNEQLKNKDIPEKSVAEDIRFSILLKNQDRLQFETFYKNVIFTDDKYQDSEILSNNPEFKDKKAQEFWYKFFLNLIRFVNYPEIRLREHKKTEKNLARRIKRGKPAIPELITIELTGILEKYIDDIYQKPKTSWHYNYCFDVKGHPRKLTSPKFKQQKEIWIEPYVKGEGKYVSSIYKIKRKQ